MKRKIFSLFLAVSLIFASLTFFSPTVLAVTKMRVVINGGVILTGVNLSEAISSSNVELSSINTIDIREGDVSTADWNYIKNNRESFSELKSITVDSGISPVADIPAGTSSGGTVIPVFPESIESVSVPQVEEIGAYAFANCRNLETVSLVALETIGEYAFTGCTKLETVYMPQIYEIGIYAFNNCSSLSTLEVPATPPTIGTDAFLDGASDRSLVFIDSERVELTGNPLNAARISYKSVDDGNTTDYMWHGWTIPGDSVLLNIGNGDITVSGGSADMTDITQGSDTQSYLIPKITITGTTDQYRISISTDANINLYNISADVSAVDNACAFSLTNNAAVALTLSGNNSLISGKQRAGLEVTTGNSITINGDAADSLFASSGNGGFPWGAGIGGSSLGFESKGGTINILGGTVTAKGGDWATGIGGGKNGAGGSITISGGIVTALGGVGIGGGAYADGGIINITGGDVSAHGGSSGIGGGYNASEANPACDARITIMEEASVKASAEEKAEAISATGGTLETGSTSKILMANFSQEKSHGIASEIYRVDGDTAVTGFIIPYISYDIIGGTTIYKTNSVAFSVPGNDKYNLKVAGTVQQYATATNPAIDFEIPSVAGIYLFEDVEDAPVLTSVTIRGTPQVGQTLAAVVSPAGADASYQWKANHVNINGATGRTYTLAAADAGKVISVTASGTGHWFGMVISDPTGSITSTGSSGRKGGTSTVKQETGLPYYIKDGKKVFVGFSSTGEYIVPKGVEVLFGENPKRFDDINGHWAQTSIEFITEREIFQGIDEKNFGPEIKMTRGMFVTAVGRLYECSYGSATGSSSFTDVDQDAYYALYVAWAHDNGIVKGTGGHLFRPDTEVTREQMGEIMLRFAAYLGKVQREALNTTLSYPDKDNISDWALNSAAYCQLTGIITGSSDGNFKPKSYATRAEVAAVFKRFVDEMLK